MQTLLCNKLWRAFLTLAEVIVYLNNSTDRTEEIASTFPNVKIVKGEFTGFGPTKNQAATYASNDWILSLDSDEIIPSALRKELETLDLSDTEKVYALKMDDYFLGHKLKFRTEKKVRLYNRSKHLFDDLKVHENVMYDPGDKIVLQNAFKHMHINTVNQTLEKTIRYSDLAAKGNKTCFFHCCDRKTDICIFPGIYFEIWVFKWLGRICSCNFKCQ